MMCPARIIHHHHVLTRIIGHSDDICDHQEVMILLVRICIPAGPVLVYICSARYRTRTRSSSLGLASRNIK